VLPASSCSSFCDGTCWAASTYPLLSIGILRCLAARHGNASMLPCLSHNGSSAVRCFACAHSLTRLTGLVHRCQGHPCVYL